VEHRFFGLDRRTLPFAIAALAVWLVWTDVTKSGQKSTGSVEVTEDGVAFFAEQGAWDGTPRQLLDQITKITTTEAGGKGFELSSSPVSIQTSSGADEVLEGFRSRRVEGRDRSSPRLETCVTRELHVRCNPWVTH
jgi:hypothetical protein